MSSPHPWLVEVNPTPPCTWHRLFQERTDPPTVSAQANKLLQAVLSFYA